MGDFGPNFADLLAQTGNANELADMKLADPPLQAAIWRGGMNGYWHELLNRARTPGWANPYLRAEALARLGKNGLAIENLEQAYETHNHLMTQLKVNPAFDGLRSDPRFQELLTRM